MGLWNIYKTVAFTVIISAIVVTSKERLSSRECEDLGFTGLALCSDCNTFAEYVKDQGYPFQPFTFLLSSFNFFGYIFCCILLSLFFFCGISVLFWGMTVVWLYRCIWFRIWVLGFGFLWVIRTKMGF